MVVAGVDEAVKADKKVTFLSGPGNVSICETNVVTGSLPWLSFELEAEWTELKFCMPLKSRGKMKRQKMIAYCS